MIEVNPLNGNKFILNSNHIEKIEEIPETVITLINGKKYLVKESSKEIVDKVIEFRRKYWANVRLEESNEEE
ncbi:endoflagellar protein [Clostridium sulfidigenes]|jgi:flagellar protein FlbD|uniref:Endoflagellar protein n=1 Tax=Clostridium sulfidigenes TaxID=318464 RepID=A0A084JIN9_9CLOT|nr:flagellar FlbD family protein [Clostridium sulfidigenes]KEZ88823.1 endoflagellar protein [Clostridium sulfidigenes]HAR85712.1 endoflagellar protein [Clostridium sp.]